MSANEEDVESARDKISNIERTLKDLEFDDAILDIERTMGQSEAFKAVPFSACIHSQGLRDSYFDAKMLHFQLLRRLDKRPEALKLLESISVEFASIADIQSSEQPALVHACRMARILKARMDIRLVDFRIRDETSETPDIFCAQFENIQQQFSQFEPFADRNNLEIVAFYAQLIRGFMCFESKESVAKEIIDTQLLFDLKDSTLTPAESEGGMPKKLNPMAPICRQLEGRCCLVALENCEGRKRSASFKKLFGDIENRLKHMTSPSIYTIFLSELAHKISDEICAISIKLRCFDDAINHLQRALNSIKVYLNPQNKMHLADIRFSLAEVCHFAERLPELEGVLRDFKKHQPEPSLAMASKLEQLAEISYIRFGDSNPRLSLDLARAALKMRSSFVDPSTDMECGLMAGGVATFLQRMKRYKESIEFLKEALSFCTGTVKGRPYHRSVIISLATAYYETANYPHVIRILRKSMPMFLDESPYPSIVSERESGPEPKVAEPESSSKPMLAESESLAAAPALVESDSVATPMQPKPDPSAEPKVDHHAALILLGRSLAKISQYKKAVQCIEEGIALIRQLPNSSETMSMDLQDLGACKMELADSEGGVLAFEESLKILLGVPKPDDRAIINARRLLAEALTAAHNYEAAADQFKQFYSLLQTYQPPNKLLSEKVALPALRVYHRVLGKLRRQKDEFDVDMMIRDFEAHAEDAMEE